MKRVALLSMCAAAVLLSSCNSSSKEEEKVSDSTELTDSLQTANAEKDSLLSLLNEISSGMAQIKDMEKLMASADLAKETPDKKEQIKNDMIVIQQAMADRRQKLEELEARLKKSANYNAEMKKTIESLRAQIESQEATIAELKSALQKAHVEIEGLNVKVDSLANVNMAVTQEKLEAQEKNAQLTERLNTCYYVVGSKSELKKYNIIETGFLRKTKIMEGDFEKSYFTKADKRTLMIVNLHSKKAKVLSNHPDESYTIVDNDGVKELKIIDPVGFWELSNYLIIQID